jgi:CPA1 family monovalent cation:H+ antiporter
LEAVTVVLFLLLAVVLSSAVARMLPLAIPRPLIQISLGAMLGLVTGLRVELDPQLFFLLFLPPLLFLSGWRIPHRETLKGGFAILQLALGLVIATVVSIDFLVHWLLPAMPIAVAFALAAVISPTDPVAVSSVMMRTPFPPPG